MATLSYLVNTAAGGGLCLQTGSSPSRTLIQQSDFTYLGYYNLPNSGAPFSNAYGANGFGMRYQSGTPYFYTLIDNGGYYNLCEFTLPGSYGSNVNWTGTEWGDIWQNNFGSLNPYGHQWLWWDTATTTRLWTGSVTDYGSMGPNQWLMSRTMAGMGGGSGTYSSIKGPWGWSAIGTPAAFLGNIQPVPSWFQSAYSVGPYCAGFGGYKSTWQFGTPKMGPFAMAFPDPSAIAAGTSLSGGVLLMDPGDGATNGSADWYSAGGTVPGVYDRGVRNTSVTNHLEPYGGTPPPTDGTYQWTSPAPDSLGRWAWNDGYDGNGVWLDGINKYGFILIGSFQTQNVTYTSYFNWDVGLIFEFHVIDPYLMGAVANGSAAKNFVYPTNTWQYVFSGANPGASNSQYPSGCIGTIYDPTAQIFYALFCGVNTISGARLYAFSLAI